MGYVEDLNDVTCLREAASAKAGNDAGRIFQHPARGLFERQDRLQRKADERVGKEAEENHAGNGTG